MSSKIVNAVYDDDDTLLHAVKDIKKAEYRIEEVFTPFPVHGLDHAMGLASTRIAITAFMYGVLGFAVAITMINYIMIVDWPMNIGGKPSFSFMENLPAFVPVIFEMTIFFAAHLMVITFYLRSRLWPFKKAENPMSETTDDKFLMQVALSGDEKKLISLLKNTGAIDVSIHENQDA